MTDTMAATTAVGATTVTMAVSPPNPLPHTMNGTHQLTSVPVS
jgi:hypothetical protein